MVLGFVLLGLAVNAKSEFTKMVGSATGPTLEDLSFPTKFVLRFVPATQGAPGQGASPADFASMINKVMFGFGSGGSILIVLGAFILVSERRQRSNNSVT